MTDAVDFTRIQETSDGDLPFEQELIDMYVEDAQNHLDSIFQLLTSADFPQIKQVAHTLKGSSANIGALKIANTAASIEKAAGLQEDISPLALELKSNFEETKTVLTNYRQTIS